MQIAGFGIDFKEIVYLLLFAFIIWVAIVCVRDSNWNFIWVSYTEFNSMFFDGADLGKGCGNLFDGLFEPIKMFEQQQGIVGIFVNIIGGTVEFILTLLNYLASLFILLYRLLVECGGGIFRLALGWTLILFVAIGLVSFLRDLRALIHGY